MQDESEEKDDELMVQVNQYLADPASAAPAGSAAAGDDAATTAAVAAAEGAAAAAAPSQSQVDALSNILQNLGMPQSEGGGGSSSGDGAAAAASASGGGAAGGGGGMLTLADLQGAMAGIQQQPTAAAPAMAPLSEVVTPAAISSLLENEAARDRLLALLPEEQRSVTHLEDNLRSPQVQQTLRALTQALLPDDAGHMDSFYSVLANFSLNPADGQTAMAANNPIQAFLDCILASVEKEKDDGGDDNNNDDGDETMDAETKQDE